MKKTLIALMALAGVASAADNWTILDTNFVTTETTDFVASSDGWYNYGFNTTYPTNDTNRANQLDMGVNGLVATGNWNKNMVQSAITLDSSALKAGYSYQITYTTYSSGSENNLVFFLSSDSYSLTLGNSYNSNKDIVLGYVDGATAGNYATYQTGAVDGAGSTEGGVGIMPTAITSVTSGDTVSPYQSMTYVINLQGGLVSGSITNGTDTYTFSQEIAESFNFDTIGFTIDGGAGAVGLKTVNVALIPEPATATLSLLALAGLAARRRRR